MGHIEVDRECVSRLSVVAAEGRRHSQQRAPQEQLYSQKRTVKSRYVLQPKGYMLCSDNDPDYPGLFPGITYVFNLTLLTLTL